MSAHNRRPRWDADIAAVRFTLPGKRARPCAIGRDGLECLNGGGPLDSADCLRFYRHRRRWIAQLALAETAERGAGIPEGIKPGVAHVRFQLACDEASDLPEVLCV
jgi:hypothetical protein